MYTKQQLDLDITLPGTKVERGHAHPIGIMMRDIAEVFESLGFTVADGPEVETEHYNFDALNIPKDHPARDMWDTFWLRDSRKAGEIVERLLLRTHTSPVQVRSMEQHGAPLRVVVPGKVFRYEATDATHEAQFHQFEGLMIGEKVSLADLKGVLELFFARLFGRPMVVRFRPSFFPFTEPSVEIDIGWTDTKGNVEKWIEVMGAGMVHPEVLRAAGVDPDKFQGFAFGGGVDRFAMLRWNIPDVRNFYNGNLSLVEQF